MTATAQRPAGRASRAESAIDGRARRAALVSATWQRSLRWHAGVFALALFCVLLSTPLDSAMTSDEGAYALQVHAVQQGSWSLDDPLATLELGADAYPFVNTELSPNGQFPLAWSPIYVRLLQASTSVFGTTLGLHLPSAVGALLAAVAAWLAAGEVARRLARPAFWLVASSPVLVNSTILWAHAASAAGAGFATWGLLRIARGESDRLAWVGLAGGTLAAVSVRSDGLGFAAAVTLALCTYAISRRRLASAVGAAGVGGAALLLFLAQRRWSSDLLGPGVGMPEARRHGADWVKGLFDGVWNGLFRGGLTDERALTIGWFVLAMLAVAGWSAGPSATRSTTRVAVALAGVVGALAARHVLAPRDLITGLVVAWPLVVVGLAARLWSGISSRERLLVAVCGLAAIAVVGAQFSGGAGAEWGGRYFSTLTVPLAVLVAGGLVAIVDRVPRQADLHRRVMVATTVAAALVPAAIGLHTSHALRVRHDRIITDIEATSPDVVVSTIGAVPRLAWRTVPEIRWLRSTSTELGAVVYAIAALGPDRIAVVGDAPPEVPGYRIEPGGDRLSVLVRHE